MIYPAEVAILELQTLISVVLSVVLGFIIGVERKHRSKEAGIRTHTIVCMGAALMTIVSKYGFGDSRIAAQIITGVGFLGAGIIIYRQQEIRGLTTAAGVWATAGIGIAAGARMYIVAAGATAIMIAIQYVFHAKVKLFSTKRMYRLNIVFRQIEHEDDIIKEVFKVKQFYSFIVREDGENSICEAALFTEKEYRSNELIAIRKANPFIVSIDRIEAG